MTVDQAQRKITDLLLELKEARFLIIEKVKDEETGHQLLMFTTDLPDLCLVVSADIQVTPEVFEIL
jgi:transcription initiation factor IIE alpha subunit